MSSPCSRACAFPREVARMTGDLDGILDYVDAMSELDISGVEPMTHAVPFDCPLRPDAWPLAAARGGAGERAAP